MCGAKRDNFQRQFNKPGKMPKTKTLQEEDGKTQKMDQESKKLFWRTGFKVEVHNIVGRGVRMWVLRGKNVNSQWADLTKRDTWMGKKKKGDPFTLRRLKLSKVGGGVANQMGLTEERPHPAEEQVWQKNGGTATTEDSRMSRTREKSKLSPRTSDAQVRE